jgi:hypothetical protein
LSELIDLSELTDWLSRFQLPFFVDEVIPEGIVAHPTGVHFDFNFSNRF